MNWEADNYRIARQGCTVVIPYREEMAKRHLKVTGDLGRIVFVVCHIRTESPGQFSENPATASSI